MPTSKATKASIMLDASELEDQLIELKRLLQFPASSFERIPKHIVEGILSNLRSLSADIIITKGPVTTSAGNSFVTVLSIKAGRKYEILTATLRALQSNFLLHV